MTADQWFYLLALTGMGVAVIGIAVSTVYVVLAIRALRTARGPRTRPSRMGDV